MRFNVTSTVEDDPRRGERLLYEGAPFVQRGPF
jgi:hypothetical protein